jgi:thiol-disulfide isomerase/thioredoxin
MVNVTDFKGKVALLHFWSIRCPACRIEEPLLEQLKQTLGPAGLEIIAVNLTDPPDEVMRYVQTNRMPFSVLLDGGMGFNLRTVRMGAKQTAFLVNPKNEAVLEVPGFPTTYILDCAGNAVAYSVGVARWESAPAQRFLHDLLGDRKACRPGSGPGPKMSQVVPGR